MINLIAQIKGEDLITVDHMGDGYVILSQVSEISGKVEQVSDDSATMIAGLIGFTSAEEAESLACLFLDHAAQIRVREANKNTDRKPQAKMDDIDCILQGLQ